MCPILIKIGLIEFQFWWIMLFLGFFIAAFLAARYTAFIKGTLTPKQALALFLYLLLGGLTGARIAYCLWHIDVYSLKPLDIFLIYKGGMISFGGLILATLLGIWYVKRKGLPVLKSADLIIVYVPIIDAMQRIGCFLNGCCFGRPTNSAVGIRPSGSIVTRHPAQLYFIGWSIVIFFILRLLRKGHYKEGTVFFSYFLLYFFGRFFIEFFRAEYTFRKGPLIAAQVVCIIGFLFFFILFMVNKKTGSRYE